MSLNIGNNVSVLTRLADKKELESIKNAQRTDLKDNVVDATKEGAESLREDLKGAVNSGKDLYIKTEKGIIKIDKKDMAATIAQLKEKVESKEKFAMIKIGFLDGAFVAQFKPGEEMVRFDTKTPNPESKTEKQPQSTQKEGPKLAKPSFQTSVGKDGVKAEYKKNTEQDDGVNNKKTELTAKVENKDISATYKSEQVTKGGDDKTKMGKVTEASYKGGVVNGSQTKTFTGKVDKGNGEVDHDETSTNSVNIDANKKEVVVKHEGKQVTTDGDANKTTVTNKAEAKANSAGVTGEVSRVVNTNDGVNDKTVQGKVVVDGAKSAAEYSVRNNTQGGDKGTFWNKEAKGTVNREGATYKATEHFKGKVEVEPGKEVVQEEKKNTDAKVDIKAGKAEASHQKEQTITDGDTKTVTKQNVQGSLTKDGVKGEVSQSKNTDDGVNKTADDKKFVLDGAKSRVEISKSQVTSGANDDSWKRDSKQTLDKSGYNSTKTETFSGKVQDPTTLEDVNKKSSSETNSKVDFTKGEASRTSKDVVETTTADGKTTKTTSNSSASANITDGTAQASKSVERVNADGTKQSVDGSVKGKVTDGEKSVGGQGNLSSGKAKVAVSGDYTITASKPKQNPDGTWSVTWTKQLTAKVNISREKLEAGLIAEGAEKKDKKFKTFEEAEKFYKSPPVSLEHKASSMQEGESASKSHKSGATLGRSATDTPIGKLSGKIGISNDRSASVTRKDAKTYEFNIVRNSSLSGSAGLEGGKVGGSLSLSSEKGKTLRFTVDISTPEGRELINNLSKDQEKNLDELVKKIEANPGNPPKGLKIVSEEDKSKRASEGKVSVKVPIGGVTVGATLAIGKEISATVKRSDNDAFEIDLQKKNNIAGSGSLEKGPAKLEVTASKKEANGLGIIIDAKSTNGKRLIELIKKDPEKGMNEILDYMKNNKGQVPAGVKLTSKSEEVAKEIMTSLGLGSYAKVSFGNTQNSSSQKTVDKDGNVTDVNSGSSGESIGAEVMGHSINYTANQSMEIKQINGILKEAEAKFSVNSSNDILTNKQLANSLGVGYNINQKDRATESRKWDVKVSFTREQIYDVARQVLAGKGPNAYGNSDSLAELEKNIKAHKNDPVEVAKAFATFMKKAPPADMRAIYLVLEKGCGYKKSDYNIEMTVTGKKGSVSLASGENAMGKAKSAVAQYQKDRKSDSLQVRANASITMQNLILDKQALIKQLNEPEKYFNELPSAVVDMMKKEAEAELKYIHEHTKLAVS